ncbi:uncharacterized protein UV8b_03050 [Ustilaginoidea virens]|uniref:THUMP domain-containing protein n=1 Tax=Ustilaginoidea virens TaxID=1159556 RepID=A0A8E5HPP0_USTVR|nr:uncharacterized protein UV8b_03050 [Ustilaginoidea virens]QUC18809.1 hypothetical protein UV8b_03050 [Ustilaginoidea virens]
MSSVTQKRKQGPPGASTGRAFKKSKGGSGGKWKTPHHKVKKAEKVELGTALDVGDQGIWVTFARGMRAKAVREFTQLCNEYGKTMYGVEIPDGYESASEVEEGQDVEAAIEAELNSMRAAQKSKTRQMFTPISTGVECLFFMKTTSPVDAAALVRRMCQDARDCLDPRQRKCKYINRLTPVSDTDKATENGITKVARTVLSPWFDLSDGRTEESTHGAEAQPSTSRPASTYAIRYNIRSHTVFKSDEVIRKVASLIDEKKHKVNLGKPDKVILIEIFQLFCGVSVVDGEEWEALKRYNMNALYSLGVTGDEGVGGLKSTDSRTECLTSE